MNARRTARQRAALHRRMTAFNYQVIHRTDAMLLAFNGYQGLRAPGNWLERALRVHALYRTIRRYASRKGARHFITRKLEDAGVSLAPRDLRLLIRIGGCARVVRYWQRAIHGSFADTRLHYELMTSDSMDFYTEAEVHGVEVWDV